MAKDSPASIAEKLFAHGGEAGALIRALDWSKTPLGPVEQWPQSLKTSVNICLNSPIPVLLWWGRDLVKLYNDSYAPMIGNKHPRALGARGQDMWPEIWDTIGPLLDGVLDGGKAIRSDDLPLLLERNAYSEECYFTFSYSHIPDESGGVGGIFTPVIETTEKVIGERRLQTLRGLAGVGGGQSTAVKLAAVAAAKVLSANSHDLPFAAIYLFDTQSDREGTLATLTAVASSPNEPLTFPETVDLDDVGWTPCSRVARGETCTLDLTSANLFPLPRQPWGAPPEQAIVLPIAQPESPAPIGFLLAGVSIRKRLDDQYREFFSQLAIELARIFQEAKTLEREKALRAEAEVERATLRDLFMLAPAGILTFRGPEHRFTLVNRQYAEMIGRKSPEELVGKTVREILPEIADQGIIEILDGVYRTGIPFIGREMLVHLNRPGGPRLEDHYFNFVYQATRNAEGQIDGILVLAIDATEQVLARQELETNEKQFRALADSIPQMAWMAEADGSIFWYNRRWYDYTGATPEQMKGWGWQSVHDPKFLPRVLARYKEALESGEPFDMVFPLRAADGSYRSFLTRALPVRDATGTIVRWFGTNTDVESQQRAEAALRRSEKLAAVGRLASSIAHEINNPLEAVTNLIYLARSTAVNPEAKLYLESAEHELERMSQITSQTLRFHKQQSAPTPTEIVELLESILTLYRGKLSREGIRLNLKTASCPPLVCYAGEIRQVLANLISNALDAMPKKGTLSLRVRPATKWDTNQPGIRFTVADTGQGMSAETRKHIYEPFYTTKGEFGTGLGLWVSAGIVEKHGGSIRVRSSSRPGESGTVFSVMLPHEKTR